MKNKNSKVLVKINGYLTNRAQLADVLNVIRQSVSRWKAGEAYRDMNKIGKLADILGTNCDRLLRNDVTSEGEKYKL